MFVEEKSETKIAGKFKLLLVEFQTLPHDMKEDILQVIKRHRVKSVVSIRAGTSANDLLKSTNNCTTSATTNSQYISKEFVLKTGESV